LLLLCLLLAFFALLMGAYFQLFAFLDFLLTEPWHFDGREVFYGATLLLISILVVRLAWRLALAILGLVTQKYDAPRLLASTRPLGADESPGLYELVREACQSIGTIPPDEIRLSPSAECYVIEERRFGFHTRRRLTLVMGLPHILVLEIAELNVILVHEMAHSGGGDTTLTVFLFRFVESLRVAEEELARRWWHRADPLYWFFAAFHQLVLRAAAPMQRRRELRADAISAETYGGTLATHTLLKEWLLENQFDNVLEQFLDDSANCLNGNIFQFFVDRWRKFGRTTEAYLQERLEQEDDTSFFDPHPSMKSRIQLMQSYPDPTPASPRPASQLLADVDAIQIRLHDQLLNELG